MQPIYEFTEALGCFPKERLRLASLPIDYAARVFGQGVATKIELWRRSRAGAPIRLGVFDDYPTLHAAAEGNLRGTIRNPRWVEGDPASWNLPPVPE